ncbi:unnamed protein product [Chrysodeixis includens]|uniref:Uncharacterized protein n=1 Tax=Chrysodeixis includens TaxID=689277 RepID=A0A9N8L6F8_CHRIL|nr:unnamed protein product [Chrysodeixis includens]
MGAAGVGQNSNLDAFWFIVSIRLLFFRMFTEKYIGTTIIPKVIRPVVFSLFMVHIHAHWLVNIGAGHRTYIAVEMKLFLVFTAEGPRSKNCRCTVSFSFLRAVKSFYCSYSTWNQSSRTLVFLSRSSGCG